MDSTRRSQELRILSRSFTKKGEVLYKHSPSTIQLF